MLVGITRFKTETLPGSIYLSISTGDNQAAMATAMLMLIISGLTLFAKVLAIASHIPSNQIGSTFFQETHPEILFKECSGYCEMVNSAEQGPA